MSITFDPWVGPVLIGLAGVLGLVIGLRLGRPWARRGARSRSSKARQVTPRGEVQREKRNARRRQATLEMRRLLARAATLASPDQRRGPCPYCGALIDDHAPDCLGTEIRGWLEVHRVNE